MGYLIIHCGACGLSWELYHRDLYSKLHRECPHCGKVIDEQTYERQILPAWGAMIDANTELFKDHTQEHRAIFTVDFKADHIFNIK